MLNTPLPRIPVIVAGSLSLDVSEIDKVLDHRLYLIYKSALLEKMAEKNLKKGPARLKMDYDKHVQFEQCFTVRDYPQLSTLHY